MLRTQFDKLGRNKYPFSFTTEGKALLTKAVVRIYLECPVVAKLKVSGAQQVKVLRCIPSRGGWASTQKLKLWVRCNSCGVRMLRRLFQSLPYVQDASFTRLGRDAYVGFVENKDCVCVRLGLIDEKLSHIIPDGESMLLLIYFKGKKDLRKFLSSLERRNVKYSVEKIESLKHISELTAIQEKILRLAYEAGYYEVPRGTSIVALAKMLGISPHALSETIRRAHKRLVEKYLFLE
jgi:hypothetical protein